MGRLRPANKIKAITTQKEEVEALQKACQELCKELLDLFKPELGCLKDYELKVKFKPDTKPIYCKPRTVPLALLDDLNQAYEAGIKMKGYGYLPNSTNMGHLWYQSAKHLHQDKRRPSFMSAWITQWL